LNTKPTVSFFVCMTPRTGSSYLCDALKATHSSGIPEEYYTVENISELLAMYNASDFLDAHENIIQRGMTTNGYFAAKLSTGRGGFEQMAELLAEINKGNNEDSTTQIKSAFPNLKCIFLTRRNKVRQAVSWWKAVQTNQFVLRTGDSKVTNDGLIYNYDAISDLLQQSTIREAGWQAFFEATNVTPHTVVYEDLMSDFEGTMRHLLDALDLQDTKVPSTERTVRRQSDELSSEWIERYRQEVQKDSPNAGWHKSLTYSS
jgi:trehalose 2-sulfotransferase